MVGPTLSLLCSSSGLDAGTHSSLPKTGDDASPERWSGQKDDPATPKMKSIWQYKNVHKETRLRVHPDLYDHANPSWDVINTSGKQSLVRTSKHN